MRRHPPTHASRVLPWIIGTGIFLGIGFWVGRPVLQLIMGKDIVDSLLAELRNEPPPTTSENAAPPDSGGSNSGGAPLPFSLEGVQLAADGFPLEPRRHVLKYTVVPGDSLFGIAERFGLHPNTIFWANTETLQDNIHLIQVGVELYILPVNGVYHAADGQQTIAEIAAQYSIAPGDILYSEYNQLSTYDSTYVPPAGLHIVVPDGRREFITWQAPIRTGTQSGSSNPEGSIHPGSCRAQYTGAGGLGQYINPLDTVSYRVTTGFASWHPGVDLAADYATPIYASETGVVVFAGWHRNGYGELIILDHGEGWTTYYGHLSSRFVGCGDQIAKGQLIGQMGMTGNATGIHLHFEVRNADSAQNPYDYIPIQDTRSAP